MPFNLLLQRRSLLALGLLHTVARAKGSQSDDEAAALKAERFVRDLVEAQNLPGVALAVMSQGQAIYSQCWGTLRHGAGTAINGSTRFCIGSLSKPFLAQVILMLKQEGRLSFDDPVERHLGEVPKDWRGMTVRHLLNHTSGLRSAGAHEPDDMILNARTQQQIRDRWNAPYSEDELLAFIKRFPLRTPPGRSFMYSNAGYTVLACLVSRLTGRRYKAFIQERIFDVLGMQSARFLSAASDSSGMAAPSLVGASGVLEEVSDELPPISKAFYAAGSGGIELSLGDLMCWDAGLSGTSITGARLPPTYTAHLSSLPELWAHPVPMNLGRDAEGSALTYGLGWVVGRTAWGQPKVSHGGFIPGYRAHYVRYLGSKSPGQSLRQLSVLVLTNQTDVDPMSISTTVGKFFLRNSA